jgi:hypothetical protein
MEQLSAVVTLLLVMDPLGNVALFLSVLKAVPPERQRAVLMREPRGRDRTVPHRVTDDLPGRRQPYRPIFRRRTLGGPTCGSAGRGSVDLGNLLLLKSATPASIGPLLLALTIA